MSGAGLLPHGADAGGWDGCSLVTLRAADQHCSWGVFLCFIPEISKTKIIVYVCLVSLCAWCVGLWCRSLGMQVVRVLATSDPPVLSHRCWQALGSEERATRAPVLLHRGVERGLLRQDGTADAGAACAYSLRNGGVLPVCFGALQDRAGWREARGVEIHR